MLGKYLVYTRLACEHNTNPAGQGPTIISVPFGLSQHVFINVRCLLQMTYTRKHLFVLVVQGNGAAGVKKIKSLLQTSKIKQVYPNLCPCLHTILLSEFKLNDWGHTHKDLLFWTNKQYASTLANSNLSAWSFQ